MLDVRKFGVSLQAFENFRLLSVCGSGVRMNDDNDKPHHDGDHGDDNVSPFHCAKCLQTPFGCDLVLIINKKKKIDLSSLMSGTCI